MKIKQLDKTQTLHTTGYEEIAFEFAGIDEIRARDYVDYTCTMSFLMLNGQMTKVTPRFVETVIYERKKISNDIMYYVADTYMLVYTRIN